MSLDLFERTIERATGMSADYLRKYGAPTLVRTEEDMARVPRDYQGLLNHEQFNEMCQEAIDRLDELLV